MVKRLLKTSLNSSFFLFGARSTGKSTWIQKQFLPNIKEPFLYIDLLDDDTEQELSKSPQNLVEKIKFCKKKPAWVIIDEVQKIPRLLDVIHSVIEKEKIKFVLTGSSARKLKISGANMLGGRAFEYRMFPYTYFEIAKKNDINAILNYGLLPQVFDYKSDSDKQKYLKSYVSTYIKMEVQIEQLVRKIEPFRNFLEIAAQMNGKITNFSKISRDVGVDTKTIQSYYEILEDTYLGFRLLPFHESIRKSQLLTPKFYFFDVGVKRALDLSVRSQVTEGTSFYGDTFEHFIILEFYKLNHYLEADFRLSFFQTPDGSEIDLILTRGREKIFVEIKSTKKIDAVEVHKLSKYARQENARAYYISQDKSSRLIDQVRCSLWTIALTEIFSL